MDHPNAELIERFYQAFQRLDGEAMAACYAPQATFHAPARGARRGREAGARGRRRARRARDFRLAPAAGRADGNEGRAQWVAHYLFTQTGRRVENRIEARFRFADGLIVEHRDHFDLWRWSRQALGLTGLLLGWTPPLQRAIRQQARKGLAAYQAAHPAAG
ncbi:nuclear transport factor 2 family protein [Pseudomonas aeruginosa]|nr:nuclear transport factor 2 family protein [Pseudomonas aeruginosa]